MKKILFIIGFSAIAWVAQSQPATTEQPKIGKHQKVKMAKELNFTKNQKKEMKELKKNIKANEASVNSNAALSESDKKQQLKQIKLD